MDRNLAVMIYCAFTILFAIIGTWFFKKREEKKKKKKGLKNVGN